ncbi:N-formylglutamate amidohydrolase [Martelella sp. AD-3]|uniref:N-formylglutamate amidohydrolase n=1 Tax=Martelella sp. AD-3 TaxID=686597 RepID=UPI00046673A9|nr:N-formylglutamate amidohydrolase [Martelella sp. AD-3]MAM09332.1 N-formylglutamate amidohydrolase [Rhizobiaceae bacterium]
MKEATVTGRDELSFDSDARWFEVIRPERQTLPLVFNSPHSGRVYSNAFLSETRLDAHEIRRSEDLYVDELFAMAPAFGAPLQRAFFPRAFLDVNREPFELDPRMFSGALPSHVNMTSMRVAGGLGTIPRIVAENMPIYDAPIDAGAGLRRIEEIYRPYHRSLKQLMQETKRRFGRAVLIDCHSMPGSVTVGGHRRKPDIVIGDRFSTSASSDIAYAAISILERMGFVTAYNKPYAGGFITEHYGRPAADCHALQIEVSRRLYADEQSYAKKPEFIALKQALTLFIQEFSAFLAGSEDSAGLAAE